MSTQMVTVLAHSLHRSQIQECFYSSVVNPIEVMMPLAHKATNCVNSDILIEKLQLEEIKVFALGGF